MNYSQNIAYFEQNHFYTKPDIFQLNVVNEKKW